MDEKAVVPNDQLDYLSDAETYAYNYFVEHRGTSGPSSFPLAYSTQEGLFQLYLNGRSCEEIRKANPQFGLGQIVYSCVDGEWERRRKEHLDTLMDGVGGRVRQIAAEGANFTADLMSVTHILWQDSINKFMQTRDPEVLKELGVGSLRSYKDLIEMMIKLTGQDQKKSVSGVVEHHIVPPPVSTAVAADPKAQLASWAAEKAAKEKK
jgi:hypothetical protein